jgi:spermidine synthase
MAAGFQVLAHEPTRMGMLTLVQRRELTLGRDVIEVKLGDEYLMSSLFTRAEEELARLGLEAVHGGRLDVVVGGLGLGFTAKAALADPRVASLHLVETFNEVIAWHRDGLISPTVEVAQDPRVTFVADDFFALALGTLGFDTTQPGRRFDAILLDVDHTPEHVLDPSHTALYTVDGLRALARHLRPGGVFALWADTGPDERFLARLGEVLLDARCEVVSFPNPLTGGTSANTVYVAVAAA